MNEVMCLSLSIVVIYTYSLCYNKLLNLLKNTNFNSALVGEKFVIYYNIVHYLVTIASLVQIW